MNATTVIGWTYDADHHCTTCTQARFGIADPPDLVPEDAEDSEGNEVHALFGDSEWWANDAYENQCGRLSCSDCHALMDEYHEDSCHENMGEDPCTFDRYVVGVNIPGYLPEGDPAYFETQEAAYAYAKEEAERIAESDAELGGDARGVEVTGSDGDYWVGSSEPHDLGLHVWTQAIEV